jgi:transcriptional regulator
MTNTLFERFTDGDVRALISEYPLALVQAECGEPLDASLLPLIGTYDEQGRLIALIGHLARANPLCAALLANPRAMILFRGPEAYVSPENAGRRDWAPTWNYVQLTLSCTIHIDDDRTAPSLDVLIDAMEDGRPDPWRASELGERYPGMLGAIIGFRADVVALRGKFKLGQDERVETLREILRTMPDAAMRRWMMRFNVDRL